MFYIKNTFKFFHLQTNTVEALVSRHPQDVKKRPSFTPLIYGVSSTQITNQEEKLVCKYYTVTSWENKGYNITLAQTKGF